MLNTMKDFLEQHIDDEEVKQKIKEPERFNNELFVNKSFG